MTESLMLAPVYLGIVMIKLYQAYKTFSKLTSCKFQWLMSKDCIGVTCIVPVFWRNWRVSQTKRPTVD